ncbi:MAG: hypothetical protein KC646_10185 [Candidatus Cloacimonetes bacterium]|nr:hypothetical protein [Candidatus Cloacimonadota bacterium]
MAEITEFTKEKKFSDILKEITLTKSEENEARDKAAIKKGKDTLNLVPGVKQLQSLVSWETDAQKTIEDEKTKRLLCKLHRDLEEMKVSAQKREDFFDSFQGIDLYSKVRKQVDYSTINEMGTALAFIINSDFENQFNEHNFAIAQLSNLSPYTIKVLSDWVQPQFPIRILVSRNSPTDENWISNLSLNYCKQKSYNKKFLNLVTFSINELKSSGLIDATYVADHGDDNRGILKAKSFNVKLTNNGKFLHNYIKTNKP